MPALSTTLRFLIYDPKQICRSCALCYADNAPPPCVPYVANVALSHHRSVLPDGRLIDIWPRASSKPCQRSILHRKRKNMAIIDAGGEAWVILHDSLQSVITYNDVANAQFTQMSYEFATWLTGWDRGITGRTAHHKRCYAIATRKSCYPGPLMTDLGTFTTNGEIVLERAKSYIRAVNRFYEAVGVTGDDIPAWDKVLEMDRIILSGVITAKQISMLRSLYVKVHGYDTSYQTKLSLELPTDVDDIFREHEDNWYLMTATFRSYAKMRVQFEQLVKYGLLELQQLPKLPEHEGRGRAPIGARFTEQGIKFYEDFLNRYDPTRVKTAEFERMRREMMDN